MRDFNVVDQTETGTAAITAQPQTTPSVIPAPKKRQSAFGSASTKTVDAAKKGATSSSRTGEALQASMAFGKPPKGLYVKLHPSPEYHAFNLPVFENPSSRSIHFIEPALYESGTLPPRFQNSCKLMDVSLAAVADGTFFLWIAFVNATPWRKAALKTIEAARRGWVIISSIVARSTYAIERATTPIDEPSWANLPPFDDLLQDAFDSIIHVSDDKVVLDFLTGGVADRVKADNDEQ